MSDFLPQYEKVDPTTWAYLSSILMLGLFFKFNRFWSVRNFDLVMLILLAPGLMLIQSGRRIMLDHPPVPAINATQSTLPVELDESSAFLTTAADPAASQPPDDLPEKKPLTPELQKGVRYIRSGFIWLLCVSLAWMIRLLLDPTMVRRPLLEPNLSLGGMAFICSWMFLFLMANVATGEVESLELDLEGSRGAQRLLSMSKSHEEETDFRRHGPGYYLVHVLPRVATSPFTRPNSSPDRGDRIDIITAKAMAILSHLALVVGMVVVGYRHFDNIRMGIGAATIYLMLPYTAQTTGHVEHVLPAALLLWAIVFYRHPLYSGMLLGLGMGSSYFALYLLPLWISFYWQRGLLRFLIGTAASITMLAGVLGLTSTTWGEFWQKIQAMFGLWPMAMDRLEGIWDTRLEGWSPEFRIPILAIFVVLSIGLALWPAQKNLGTLLSCSAAVMVATQFWHGQEGGLYMAWYLPLTLLTVFRPNLEDRVALSVLGEGWFPRNRAVRLNALERAA